MKATIIKKLYSVLNNIENDLTSYCIDKDGDLLHERITANATDFKHILKNK